MLRTEETDFQGLLFCDFLYFLVVSFLNGFFVLLFFLCLKIVFFDVVDEGEKELIGFVFEEPLNPIDMLGVFGIDIDVLEDMLEVVREIGEILLVIFGVDEDVDFNFLEIFEDIDGLNEKLDDIFLVESFGLEESFGKESFFDEKDDIESLGLEESFVLDMLDSFGDEKDDVRDDFVERRAKTDV